MKKILTITVIALLLLFCAYKLYHNHHSSGMHIDETFVEIVEQLQPPTFPERICDIIDYGAVGDGKTLNTEVFKKAIADCTSNGGGTVRVPVGIFKTGAIHLKSNINLHISKDATILFSDNFDDFLPPVKTRFIGLELYNYSPFIYAQDCENIAITGDGTIDGNGAVWNDFIGRQKKAIKRLYKQSLANVPTQERIFGTYEDALRPSLIQSFNCKNFFIEGINIKEGPMWTIHPVYTENIIIKNVRVETEGPNTDGIVIDSSRNVLIENANFSTGDDAIAIKSGRDEEGWRIGESSENIVIRAIVVDEAHGGVSIGSEMSGDVRNILIEGITIHNADRGVRMKTREGRGGIIENVIVRNSSIKNTGSKEPIQITLDYGSSTLKPKTDKKPRVHNIIFENIKIDSTTKKMIKTVGLKNKLYNISFRNITTTQAQAITVSDSADISFENVATERYELENAKDVEIKNEQCPEVIKEKSRNIVVECWG